MSAWCLRHNALLWTELGNTSALGLASAVATDRLRADPRFRDALAAYGNPLSREDAARVLREIGPICCFMIKAHPEFMTEIVHEGRRLAAERAPKEPPQKEEP